MARRTCIFFISLFLLTETIAVSQDTVTVPLHIRAGFDISGPVMKLVSKDLISYGVAASVTSTHQWQPLPESGTHRTLHQMCCMTS